MRACWRCTTLLNPETTFQWGRGGEQDGLSLGRGARTSHRPSRRADTGRALWCCSKGVQTLQAPGAPARGDKGCVRQRRGWNIPRF